MDWPQAQDATRTVTNCNDDGTGFFFQAEDGIRDGTVTGVQTCALPIYLRRERRALLLLREDRLRELGGLTLEMYRRDHFNETLIIERCAELVAIEARASERSEERRVGKECRSRWSPDH